MKALCSLRGRCFRWTCIRFGPFNSLRARPTVAIGSWPQRCCSVWPRRPARWQQPRVLHPPLQTAHRQAVQAPLPHPSKSLLLPPPNPAPPSVPPASARQAAAMPPRQTTAHLLNPPSTQPPAPRNPRTASSPIPTLASQPIPLPVEQAIAVPEAAFGANQALEPNPVLVLNPVLEPNPALAAAARAWAAPTPSARRQQAAPEPQARSSLKGEPTAQRLPFCPR